MISEKVSEGACFITVVHPNTNVSTQDIQKNCVLEFPNLSALITFIWTSGFYWYGHVYTHRKAGISKHFWKKITYATALDICYLFTKKTLNIELNMILVVLIEFVYIRHSRNLQQIWWIPRSLSRWWIWQSVSL